MQEVRSIGLMTAIILRPETAKPAQPALPHRIRLRLKERGILLRPLGDVLYVMPPLTIRDEEIGTLAREVLAALDTL